MKDLMLIDGDLVFQDGDLQLIEGPDELAQEMEVELQTNRGEFFLAPDEGLPFNLILQKMPNPEMIRTAVTDTLGRNPRITRLDDLQTDFDAKRRHLDIRVTATGTDDETATVGVNRNA